MGERRAVGGDPRARRGEIVDAYVTSTAKLPWYIDLLNLNLDNEDLDEARSRIAAYLAAFARGERLTANQSFGDATSLVGSA